MKKKDEIRVSEMFYSIQGEGITMGVPSVFIRLTACNLLCKGKDWVCDTIPVWTKGDKMSVRELVKDVFRKYHKYFVKGTHLVFTGGEPMIQQQAILEFIDLYYRKYEYIPFLEIETNGTIEFDNELLKEFDLINCSPKLCNSGMKEERRIKADVLRQINNYRSSIFKFVVTEQEDLQEIEDLIDLLDLKPEKIVLMPAGDCREQLHSLAPMVAEMCKENNYYYGSRLQVDIWDEVTGV